MRRCARHGCLSADFGAGLQRTGTSTVWEKEDVLPVIAMELDKEVGRKRKKEF